MEKNNDKARFYTHCVVSYASLDELKPLLEQCKHYAFICHDKVEEDNSPGIHYHILCTFAREKSFAWVRKQVVSEQNTFTKLVEDSVDAVLCYFTHEKEPHKGQYDKSKIVFDDEEYWRKRCKDGESEENKNDVFIDDLCSDNFSVERMGRLYGRDFLKNIKSYMFAREIILAERKGYSEYNKTVETQIRNVQIEQACEMLADWSK